MSRDDELNEEIRRHLEMAADDRVARGASREDAMAAARRELGNIGQIQEATRDVWGWRWFERLVQDLRYGLRTFRRNPGFAAVAILSLALGIGANTALFQVVDAVRLRALPISDPDTLADIHIVDMEGARGSFQTRRPAVTHPIWRQILARQQAFSPVFAWGTDEFNLTTGGEMRGASGLWVSGDLFNALGVRPIVGRTIGADDDRPGCPARAVLSYAFWQRNFGGDPTAVGRTVMLSARPVEIVGVTPPSFFGLEVGHTFDVALPICAEPVFSDDGKGRLDAGTTWWLTVFGRLKPGWTLDRATAHLQAISPDLFKTALPSTYPAESVQKYLGFKLTASSARTGVSSLREDFESPLWLLLSIAGLVFFIACANLTNLLLARATARSREIAIRLSLGASRGRVIRQLLTESLLLAAIGAVFGVLLASTLSRSLVTFLNTDSSTITLPLSLDWRILGFSAGLAAATCALFGLAPALRATRVGAGSVMRATGRGNTANRDTIGLRQVLVVAQVAVSVALLFGSLLFARSLLNAMLVDPGFHAEGVTIVGVNFRALDVPEDRRQTFRRELIDRIRSLPGITSAAYVGIVPISGSSSGNDVWPEADRSRRFNMLRTTAGPGFFATLGIPVLAGRDFEDRDAEPSRMVAIVNETFAEKLSGKRSPLGARFTIQATPSRPEETYEIVGVVRNSKYMHLKESPEPVLYTAEHRPVRYAEIVVRSALPPSAVTGAITTAMANVDSRIGLTYTVFTTQIRDTLVLDRLLAMLSGGFSTLAAILTIVGLYGLIAYSVTRRTSEIGVRMALGAQRSDIARLMLRETSILLAVGIVVGIGVALAGARAASALLFGVRPHDPLTLAGAIAGLALIAFAASYAPTRRATRIEPVAALRVE